MRPDGWGLSISQERTMQQSEISGAIRRSGEASPVRTALIVAGWAFAPMAILSLLGAHYAELLSFIPSKLPSNFAATQRMLGEFLYGSSANDSWKPMIMALDAVRGPGKNSLYETVFFAGHIRFQYPPTSLLAISLLSSLHLLKIWTLNRLNVVVYLLNAAALTFLAFALFRRTSRQDSKPLADPAAMALMTFAASFLFYPLVKGALLGQVQIWIDFLFTAVVIAWLLNYRGLAGLLVGIACSLKPQLAVLLLWAVLWGEWVFALGILAAFLSIALLSVGLFGLHNHVEYLSVLSFLSRHGEVFYPNNSINGILNWYLSPYDPLQWTAAITPYNPAVFAGTVIMSLVGLAVIILPALKRRGRRAGLEDMAVAAISSVVSAPVAWEHHYGILLPLYLVMLWRMLRGGAGKASVALFVLSWTLVANFIAFAFLLHASAFALVQAYCFFGALLLLGLFLQASLTAREPERHSRNILPARASDAHSVG